MRRYEKGTKFYRQNNTFKTDKKKFYTELGKPIVTIEKSSSKEEVETFWISTGMQRRIVMKKLNGSNRERNDAKA